MHRAMQGYSTLGTRYVSSFTLWPTLSPGNKDAGDHCVDMWLGGPHVSTGHGKSKVK
jgi:hypothetical protein